MLLYVLVNRAKKYRLIFSRFLYLREDVGNVKEKLVFPVKRSSWFHVYTLQNFAK